MRSSKKTIIAVSIGCVLAASAAYAWWNPVKWVRQVVVKPVVNVAQVVTKPIQVAIVQPVVNNVIKPATEAVVNGVINFGVNTLGPIVSPIAPSISIPVNALKADGIVKFSPISLRAFGAVEVRTDVMGNAFFTNPPVLSGKNLQMWVTTPVARVTIKGATPVSGDAMNSVIQLSRVNPDEPDGDVRVGVIIANFQIDFSANKVIADLKQIGKPGSVRVPVYDFTPNGPLAIRYAFPASVTGKQVLQNLKLTAEARAQFAEGLKLARFELAALDTVTNFGEIDVDIQVGLRSRPVPDSAYPTN